MNTRLINEVLQHADISESLEGRECVRLTCSFERAFSLCKPELTTIAVIWDEVNDEVQGYEEL